MFGFPLNENLFPELPAANVLLFHAILAWPRSAARVVNPFERDRLSGNAVLLRAEVRVAPFELSGRITASMDWR
jgi:hypothetical protein